MWSCLCWRCDLLTTSNKCNKLSSCVYCHLLAFFACETLHSIQHYFYKTNPFHIFWSFNSHFSIGPWLQQLREILKATALQREKSVSLGKLLCVTLTSSTSQGHYAIALKFSAKQINLIRKKSVSVICKIMNINGDFRIIVNANHGAFMKNTKTQIKLKPIFFFENCGHTFVEIAMILTCANIQRKILMFAEVGDSESSFWDWKLRPAHFMNIWFILNNPRFNNWL